MRVAFHAVNGVGWGHLVRSVALAIALRELVPEVAILVLTTAGDTRLLEDAGLDYVKLPPRLAEPHADPSRAAIALPEPLDEAALEGALSAFVPDLVVFDTHAPLALVRRLRDKGARTVLVLREVRPDALRSFAAKGGTEAFDRIVIPQEAGDMDLAVLAGAPVERVGPIVLRRGRPRRERRRTPARPLLLALAGAGGQPVDARRYLSAVADAHWLARARSPHLETILVTGPYGEPPEQARLYEGLSVRRSVRNLEPLLGRATLVVSQAGYNAIGEIRAAKTPAVLVPGVRKSEDQRARALRLVHAGAATLARPEARSIADKVVSLLEAPALLERMERAHAAHPIVPRNREAAEALLRPISRLAGPVRRVLIVAHDFAPRLGGMETVALGLATNLLQRGIEVRILTLDRLGASVASGLPAGVVRPVYPMRGGRRRIDLDRDLLITLGEALEVAPDVIHLSNAGLAPWVESLRATLPSAVTVHVHGNDFLAPWVDDRCEGVSPLGSAVDGLNESDGVVCVSEFSASLAQGAGVDAAVVRVVSNGVDSARFCPGPWPTELGARLGIDPSDEVLLTVSRLAARKGHATLIHAVALLAKRRPKLKFVFTGSNDALLRALLEQAKALGVGDRVIPTGFLRDVELPSLYRLAHVFALAPDAATDQDVEGFGVALLEAAAAGLPVIGTSSGGVPEAVADGETGALVAPGDAAAIASKVDAWLDDARLRAELGERGRARAMKSFSADGATGAVLDLWSHVLASGRRTRTETHAGARGASLASAALEAGRRSRAESERRRSEIATHVARGKIVRFRATGEGAPRLGSALADAVAVGVRPRVEVKLRRFLEDDFQTYALPNIDAVELVHGVPHEGSALLIDRLARTPTLAHVRAVRLFLNEEAHRDPALAASAVPEVFALRRVFRSAGAVVTPPPELMRYLSETPAGGPATAMIEPTNLCNLACPTCPTGTGKIKPLPSMTLAHFEGALDELGPQVRNLALWNYGEPLLNRELSPMIRHAKKKGVGVVKVSSNVHFLDQERGTALLQSGLDVLILSVDGASQETYGVFRKDGDFARVAASVSWLTEEKRRLGLTKPRIELQFIVMKHNEHELDEMRRLARVWGVDKLRIKTVGADDPDTKHLIPTERLLSRYDASGEAPNRRHAFCTMAWDHAVINVDGSVTPCCYLRPDMGDAFVMGNVFQSSFREIWRGSRYQAFRKRILEGRASMPVCSTCRGGTHDLIAAVEEVAAS